jgi:hypothetical protein
MKAGGLLQCIGGFGEASHIPTSRKHWAVSIGWKLEASCMRWEVLGAFYDWAAVQAYSVDSLTFVEMRKCGSTREKMFLLSFYSSESVT